MFSGLTNQVSSWMGSSAKGEEEEEEKIPTPTDENATTLNAEKKDFSPTKHTTTGSSRLDVLSNVKSQIGGIGGWLGSSIPKLRKGDDAEHQEEISQQRPLGNEGNTPASAESVKGFAQQKDNDEDDDNSSATGGADSGPQSIAAETPTEEKDGNQFGNVQSKAIAGAKSFGNFLYSAVNKAGKTVSEAGAKIKKTVEENSILGEFNKEQEAFVKTQASNNTASALPPWAGCPNESALKEECLSLSTDRRNFVRSPPTGVDFHFDYEVSYPIAMAIMEQDPNLEKMRYELVPKVLSEENFWRNYFYRVTLICQANDLSYMSRDGDNQLLTTDTTSSDQPIDSRNNKGATNSSTQEFVSDTLQASSQDLVEVRESMKKLAIRPAAGKEEEWEKELEAELQDYEVVNEQKTGTTTTTATRNENWEEEMEAILKDEDIVNEFNR